MIQRNNSSILLIQENVRQMMQETDSIYLYDSTRPMYSEKKLNIFEYQAKFVRHRDTK